MTLRVPPIIGQNLATLPDGSVDPAHANDCGESCVSSAVLALKDFYFAPGCVRVAVNSRSGLTTSDNLSWLLQKLGMGGKVDTPPLGGFKRLRHWGFYQIALGTWIDPAFEHWMLFYQRTAAGVWAMDPYRAQYALVSDSRFKELSAGVSIEVHP